MSPQAKAFQEGKSQKLVCAGLFNPAHTNFWVISFSGRLVPRGLTFSIILMKIRMI
jgi:hypothetical protein